MVTSGGDVKTKSSHDPEMPSMKLAEEETLLIEEALNHSGLHVSGNPLRSRRHRKPSHSCLHCSQAPAIGPERTGPPAGFTKPREDSGCMEDSQDQGRLGG